MFCKRLPEGIPFGSLVFCYKWLNVTFSLGNTQVLGQSAGLDGQKLILTSLLVWDYLRAPSQNLSCLAGYLSD